MAFRRDDEFEFSEEQIPGGKDPAEGREPGPADPDPWLESWSEGADSFTWDAPDEDPLPWDAPAPEPFADDPLPNPFVDELPPDRVADEDFLGEPELAAGASAADPLSAPPDLPAPSAAEYGAAAGLDREPRENRVVALVAEARAHPVLAGLAVVFAVAAIWMLSNRSGDRPGEERPVAAGTIPGGSERQPAQRHAVVAGGGSDAGDADRASRKAPASADDKNRASKRRAAAKQAKAASHGSPKRKPKPKLEPEPAPEPEYAEPEYAEPEYVEPEYTAEPAPAQESSAPPSSASASPPSEEFGFER